MATIPESRPAAPSAPAPSAAWYASPFAQRLRYPLAVYVVSRVIYAILALLDSVIRNWPLGHELRNWDGKWYLLLAHDGYPTYIPHQYSTLGFEPLYSLLIVGLHAILPFGGDETAGLLIALILGGVAVVEMDFLAEHWFGAERARRATLFLCIFPGTIVFSMVYSEALGLALIAGSMLAVTNRRWVTAGLCAAGATAVAPVLLAIVPALGLVSLRELYRRGIRDRDALRSLAAPVLSAGGIGIFGIYLWFHDNTPLASYKAQHDAWDEKSSILAVWHQAKHFYQFGIQHWHGFGRLDMNLFAGVVGAIFLIWALTRMWRQGGVPLVAWIYTAFVALLTLTSEHTPPNPRMLLCAFPVLLAVGARYSGRAQKILLVITFAITCAMSIGTFAGFGLRP